MKMFRAGMWLIVGAIVVLGLSAVPSHAANILLNGSFESNLSEWIVGGGNTGYPVAVIRTDGINGDAFGEVVPIDTASIPAGTLGSPDAAGTHGVYFVDDRAMQSLTQAVTLGIGSYEIGFDAYLPRNGYGNPGDATFDGSIAQVVLANFTVKTQPATSIGVWTHFYGIADVTVAGSYDASFIFNTFGGASADVVIDRVYIVATNANGGTPINPVPEPSTILLLGSGLVGLVGYGRKKFNK